MSCSRRPCAFETVFHTLRTLTEDVFQQPKPRPTLLCVLRMATMAACSRFDSGGCAALWCRYARWALDRVGLTQPSDFDAGTPSSGTGAAADAPSSSPASFNTGLAPPPTSGSGSGSGSGSAVAVGGGGGGGGLLQGLVSGVSRRLFASSPAPAPASASPVAHPMARPPSSNNERPDAPPLRVDHVCVAVEALLLLSKLSGELRTLPSAATPVAHSHEGGSSGAPLALPPSLSAQVVQLLARLSVQVRHCSCCLPLALARQLCVVDGCDVHVCVDPPSLWCRLLRLCNPTSEQSGHNCILSSLLRCRLACLPLHGAP